MTTESTNRRDGVRLREEHRARTSAYTWSTHPTHRHLRRAPPAGRRADLRLRALRLLPAHLPHLHAVGGGDGLPARADLPDEAGQGGRGPARRHLCPALRRVPGLHGLCDGVPVRREVRRADRGGPPPAGAQLPAQPRRPPVPGNDLPALPVPDPAARRRRRGCALPTRGRSLPAGAQRAAQAAASAAAGGRGADAAGAAARPDPAAARVHPGPGHRAAAPRRHAGGMRPAGVLPRRQRGNGARAGAGRLRRDCAARAAVLRRAQRARRPGTGGAGAGPSTDRRFRTRRRGRHRGERGRLRLHDEGVRPAAARRPEVRRTGGGVLGEGARHLGGARRPGARRAAAPHRGPGRLPRRLPSRARPARPAPAAGGAAHHPGPGGDRHPGGRHLLRFGRHLQHGAARRRCRTGPAQDRQRHVGGAGRGGHGQSRMPPADTPVPARARADVPPHSARRRVDPGSRPYPGPRAARHRGRRRRTPEPGRF